MNGYKYRDSEEIMKAIYYYYYYYYYYPSAAANGY
jgi:hypothetical protein